MVGTRTLGLALALGLVAACRSHSGTTPEPPAPVVRADAAPVPRADDDASVVAATSTDDERPATQEATFEDPPWFRTSLFPDATVLRRARSSPDEDGLFASSILFALPDGYSAAACADYLQQQLGTAVPAVVRTQLPDGRWELRGETERYVAVIQCGSTANEVRAYVSYTWTSG